MTGGGRGGGPTLLVLASAGWGGTEKAVVDLANDLAARQPVAVAIPTDAVYRDRLSPDVAVHTLRAGSRRNPLVLRDLARLVRDLDPSVVHSHAARATEMVHWVTRFVPVVHVATKHNTRPRRIFSRPRWVTAVSEQAARAVRNPHGVEVVYDGVDDLPPPAPRAGPGPGRPLALLAVGRLHRYKGLDRLVQSLSAARGDMVLRIAGEGPARADLEALAREAAVADRVHLLGHREDVPALLAEADALVVPSRTEGFGMVVVEGLLACSVVLSTPVGIAPEILPDMLLFEPDALSEKLSDLHARYDDYRARTAAVREDVGRRFSRTESVTRYTALYRRAIETESTDA